MIATGGAFAAVMRAVQGPPPTPEQRAQWERDCRRRARRRITRPIRYIVGVVAAIEGPALIWPHALPTAAWFLVGIVLGNLGMIGYLAGDDDW